MSLRFPEFGSGSCINCGSLSRRRSAEVGGGPTYDEVTTEQRTERQLRHASGEVWCHAGVARLRKEVQAIAGANAYTDEALEQVIRMPRNCPEFYTWREGLSPNEHERRRFEERVAERAERAEADRTA